jgi:hypothetical protein
MQRFSCSSLYHCSILKLTIILNVHGSAEAYQKFLAKKIVPHIFTIIKQLLQTFKSDFYYLINLNLFT